MIYRGKIVGEFSKTQEVTADSKEEAIKMLMDNVGQDIEETATGEIQVLSIEEFTD